MQLQLYAIIIEQTCLMFTMVLFLAGLFMGWKKNMRGRLFLSMAGVWAVALLVDSMAWWMDLVPGINALDWIFSTLSCCTAEVMVTLFIYYMLALLRERGKKLDWTMGHIAFLLNFVGLLLTVIFSLQGNLYVADETGNALVPGDYYIIVGFTPILTMLGTIFFVVLRRQRLGPRVMWTAITYLALPTLGYILEVFLPNDFPASMPMTSIALMIVYVVLQSHEIDDTRERERILEELSTVDVMTGANNRRSFEERIAELDPLSPVCAVFTDINSLKHTNDTLGHDAGDKLVVEFAAIMRHNFGKKNIFRISGDEFVAVYPAPNREDVDKRVEAFRKEVAEHDDIASVGVAYGTAKHILTMMDDAEKLMYEDKDAYYVRTGKPRRH